VVAEQGFELGFRDSRRLGNLQELEDVRLAEQVARLLDGLSLGSQLEHAFLVLAGRQTEEQPRLLLPDEFPDRPAFADHLPLVEASLQWVVDLQEFDRVRPAQKVRRCRTFWEGEVELPHVNEVAAAETLAVAEAQVPGQPVNQRGTVLGLRLPTLLELDDVPADLPVGFDELDVDRLRRPSPARGTGGRDPFEQVVITINRDYFHANPILSRWPFTFASRSATRSVSAEADQARKVAPAPASGADNSNNGLKPRRQGSAAARIE
jgi:hypothetical protein